MTWNGMKDDEELKEKVFVECELSAVIQAGDRKCLSNFRSFSNHTCRICDLAAKIELRINPEILDKDIFKDFVNTRPQFSSKNKKDKEQEEKESEEPIIEEPVIEELIPVEISSDKIEKNFFKLRGKTVFPVFFAIKALNITGGILEIRGLTKGFRNEKESVVVKTKRALSWHDFTEPLLMQVIPIYYYEVMFRHSDEKILQTVRGLLEQFEAQPAPKKVKK
jgi:hypothetical protein